jgi:hypothetical protein
MMTEKDIPLQHDLFTGERVDTRSAAQKRRDEQAALPQQQVMFPQREVAQFGVCAHPQMALAPGTKLVLVSEDPRTEEEKERDRQLAAQALTPVLFAAEAFDEAPVPEERAVVAPPECQPDEAVAGLSLPVLHPVGYRRRSRLARSRLRLRQVTITEAV